MKNYDKSISYLEYLDATISMDEQCLKQCVWMVLNGSKIYLNLIRTS